MQCDSPIDIVYLWVNGNDPTWRGKRRRAAQRLSAGHRSALGLYGNVEGRFRDNGELRYSLRALEQFFPSHGHVYLVTDGQTPAWLRPSDRLTLVDHRDLIPQTRLPTFDSGNIESYIHRIPALSERFIYLNDDVFFGAPVRTDDWFWEGGVYAAWSDEAMVADGPLRRDANSMDNATRLSRQWLAAPYAAPPRLDGDAAAPVRRLDYTHTARTFAHAPRPLLRSVLFELEGLAPELFASVRSTVFRTWDKPTIVSDFVIRWALAHGVTRMRDYRHSYLSTGDADIGQQLDRLVSADEGLDFFCINDTTDNAPAHDPRLVRVRESLKQMFPLPSSFEQPAARVNAALGELRAALSHAAALDPTVAV